MDTSLIVLIYFIAAGNIIAAIFLGIDEACGITKVDRARKAWVLSDMLLGICLGTTLFSVGGIVFKSSHLTSAVIFLFATLSISYGVIRNLFVFMKIAQLQSTDKEGR